jgi:hypothetical protein
MKNNPKTINLKEYAQYQETLSELINQVNTISDEIHDKLFDLACLGKWKKWDKKQPVGTVFHVTEDMLRNTGDKNIDLLWEILDKIEEVREGIQKR